MIRWISNHSKKECSVTCVLACRVLRGQDLSGMLPPELVKLPFLQQIDLTHNYLNGSIPKVWGSMKLVNISLDGNRLSGGLPVELSNISTLVNLTLDSNYFSGVLPSELGNMPSIEKWSMNSNNFTGPLPETFAKLTTLTDLSTTCRKGIRSDSKSSQIICIFSILFQLATMALGLYSGCNLMVFFTPRKGCTFVLPVKIVSLIRLKEAKVILILPVTTNEILSTALSSIGILRG